jgi:hypothetical protein
MSRKGLELPGVKESRRSLNLEARFHKFGFVVLLLIVFLAVGGVFSDGYFSHATRKNTNKSVIVDYERFGRWQTEFKLKISSVTQHAGRNTFRIGGDFNSFYEVEHIWPQPDSMYSKGGELFLVYNKVDGHQDMSVWLLVTPEKPGDVVSLVQLNTDPEIYVRQLIYP